MAFCLLVCYLLSMKISSRTDYGSGIPIWARYELQLLLIVALLVRFCTGARIKGVHKRILILMSYSIIVICIGIMVNFHIIRQPNHILIDRVITSVYRNNSFDFSKHDGKKSLFKAHFIASLFWPDQYRTVNSRRHHGLEKSVRPPPFHPNSLAIFLVLCIP